jgi:Gpi18-like mannosyltransferase
MKLEEFTKNSPIQIHHMLYFVFLVIILPKNGFYFDMIDRPQWATYMVEYGLTQMYGSKANYLPLPMYLLYAFGLLFNKPTDISTYFYLYKIIILVFDFAVILTLVYVFRQFVGKYIEYAALLSIAFLYNTFWWGQQDAIHTALLVFSILCILKQRPLLGIILLLLAINAKLQAVIYIPIIGIVALYYFSKNPKLILKAIPTVSIVQLLILLPFLLTHQLRAVLNVINESVGFFPSVSWSAYNLWYLLTKSTPHEINDTAIFIKFSYRTWGFLLFFLSSGIALIPMLLSTWQKIKYKLDLDKQYYSLTFLTSGLITVLFFFVNTQMHERYSHPALALFFGYGLLTRKYWLYALTSVAYFLNLEMMYGWFRNNFYHFDIKPEIVSLMYLLIVLICFWDLGKRLTNRVV